MLVCMMRSSVSSCGMPAKCTTALTSTMASVTAPRFRTSAVTISSPGCAEPSAMTSSSRTTSKRPRNPSRRIVPIVPPAPVIKTRRTALPSLSVPAVRLHAGHATTRLGEAAMWGYRPMSTTTLCDRMELVVKGALMSGRERGSSLLQSPAGKPVDAVSDCKLHGLKQEHDRMIRVSLVDPRQGEVNKESEAGMWCARLGKCLLKQCGCRRVTEKQQCLAGVPGNSRLVPDDKQP